MADNRDNKGVDGAHRYFPAEWEPHRACLMLYPHNPCTFRLEQAQKTFVEIASAIAIQGQEDVLVFVPPHLLEQAQKQFLVQQQNGEEETEKRIHCYPCPSNDSWSRDTGPTFCVQNPNDETPVLVGLDWGFNAYGGLYHPYRDDQELARIMCETVAQHYGIPVQRETINLILEGGSIHTDGKGTILTTQQCLLHPTRNPTLQSNDIAQRIQTGTSSSKMVWIPRGLDGDDDTHGHVDNLACFVRPGHVLLSYTNDQTNDPVNYQLCRQAQATLEQEHLTVHKLYLPPPTVRLLCFCCCCCCSCCRRRPYQHVALFFQ